MDKYIKMFKIITHQGNAVKTTVKYTAYIYPYNSAVLLLGTFLGEMNTFIHKKTHIRIIVIASHQVALVVKNPPTSEGDIRDASLIPGSGRSTGEGHGSISSILAWRIPWTEESGGLQSVGSQRVRHD